MGAMSDYGRAAQERQFHGKLKSRGVRVSATVNLLFFEAGLDVRHFFAGNPLNFFSNEIRREAGA